MSLKNSDKPVQEKKDVVKIVGTVTWFNVKSGYGFITRTDNNQDVFVHVTAIRKYNRKKIMPSLGEGEVVEFQLLTVRNGFEASNVTGPGGKAVKGSPYIADRRRDYRRKTQPRKPRADNRKNAEKDTKEETGDQVASQSTERVAPRKRTKRVTFEKLPTNGKRGQHRRSRSLNGNSSKKPIVEEEAEGPPREETSEGNRGAIGDKK